MKVRFLVRFLYLLSLLWVGFTVLWFFRDSPYRYLYTVVGAVYTVVLSLSAYLIDTRQSKQAWWVATIYVGLSLLASIFDEIGWIDVLFIAGTSMIFVMLLIVRPQIEGKRKPPGKHRTKRRQ